MDRFRFVILFFFFVTLSSAQMIISQEVSASLPMHKGISFLEDKEGIMTLTDALKQRSKFTPVTSDVPNFGISASTYWLKLEIQNNTHRVAYLLQIAKPNLDEVDLFQINHKNQVTCIRAGEYLPFYYREFADPDYIFRLKLDTTHTNEIYLKVKSKDNFQVPLAIGTQKTIFETNKLKDTFFGLYSGIMIVMFLYNMFLFFTVNDKTYLYYIIYIATVFLTQIGIQGYAFQYLWPDSPWFAQYSPFILSPLPGITAAYFMRLFLNSAYFYPRLDRGFRYFTITYVIAVLLSFFGQFAISYLLITITAFGISMYMLVIASFIASKKKYKPARFFLLAWSMFLFGVTIYAMTNLGVLPINNFTFYTMPFGSAAEVVLLSLALADRINILKKEKEESQAEALIISQQNQKLISDQNVILEQKVHERTLELEETNEELNVTLTYLKDTQTQLVDAEKMASLGQLTAGIAHEINNPINFVSANLKPLKMDISEVFDVITKYETIRPQDKIEEKLKEIEIYKKKIDIDYLRTEIETLLSGIEDGARRTAEIVSGLKNFSRLDESDMKLANINEGIESTLVLLKGNIPKNVEVITELGDLPFIECLPGKLNQVFMNILTNAIYAMIHNNTVPSHVLSIRTYVAGEHVCASFQDTGTGMSPEVKAKVFEPFFTTKDVGEGTGLGMSIVFKIVESHHARIEIETEPGKGTKMTLILNKKLT